MAIEWPRSDPDPQQTRSTSPSGPRLRLSGWSALYLMPSYELWISSAQPEKALIRWRDNRPGTQRLELWLSMHHVL